jgi:hypothetical protein
MSMMHCLHCSNLVDTDDCDGTWTADGEYICPQCTFDLAEDMDDDTPEPA